MSQNLPVINLERIENHSKFNKDFIYVEHYNEGDEEYFLVDVQVDVQCPEKLHELHSDLPFLTERMKIEKGKKLVTHLNDKTEYVIYIRNLKQALNDGLILKKVHRF